MTKFNVGDKVRYISDTWFDRGDVLYVVGDDGSNHVPLCLSKDRNADVYCDDSLHVGYDEVEPYQSESNRRLPEAEAKIASLEAEVKALKQTPNQRRADVIRRAQAFVADLEKRAADEDALNSDGNELFNIRITRLEFHVNAEKRVVTALAKYYNGEVAEKAFAKCAPGDVFNADIGKAIAAGYLFGVKVPKEFTDAPKPTEVVIGHIVKNDHVDDLVGKVTGWCPKFDARRPNGKAFRHTVDVGYMHTSRVSIIDDTDAVYL